MRTAPVNSWASWSIDCLLCCICAKPSSPNCTD
ncbi:Uncharacterised protein [Vibrio cholerae]|nr:Uncharacterised protein [Vibrio cholerae]